MTQERAQLVGNWIALGSSIALHLTTVAALVVAIRLGNACLAGTLGACA